MGNLKLNYFVPGMFEFVHYTPVLDTHLKKNNYNQTCDKT